MIEQKEVSIESIKAQREILIQAAIVRIMKKERNLGHTNLLIEMTRELQHRFRPEYN